MFNTFYLKANASGPIMAHFKDDNDKRARMLKAPL